MAETVIMPKLGFDMSEGTLVRWVIQEGEPVEKGTILAEIETDKATVEVESNFSGIVARHLIPAGEIVPVNTPIAIIADPGENLADAAKVAPAALVQKTGAEVEAPADESPRQSGEDRSESRDKVEEERLPDGLRASPLARRMAADMGISLNEVKGSGQDGRIVAKDIQEYLSAPASAEIELDSKQVSGAKPPAAVVQSTAGAPVKPDRPLPYLSPLPSSSPPADQVFKPGKLRAAIGRRMLEAKQQVPHFYVTHEYDVENLLSLRKQINEMLPDEQKISVNDFIVKATALGLRQFPNLNVSLKDNQITQHGSINIGVAVAVEGGLLTVVCRDADRKNLREIAGEIRLMAARAREGKVRPEEIEGSTFSVSNLGMYAVEDFIAIINPPEAAILAVSSARQIPVVKDGEVAVGWRMKATISVDHRVSDGAEAARFMQALAPYLEEPLLLLI